MFKAIGLLTGKVYVVGEKEQCYRELMEIYPSYDMRRIGQTGAIAEMTEVLPEPIQIIRKGDLINELGRKFE